MFKAVRLFIWIGLLVVALVSLQAEAKSPQVVVLPVKGTVNPVLADYISRGIDHAEAIGAEAVIIQLDTPGGLDISMRDIVQSIVNSRVPVVVYVSPSGARSASAGVFITMAAHVAVMAPNTAIGAAHPVSLGAEGEQQMSETMQEKVLNDAAAYIRSIAEAHGRNMEWAEKAVRESVSASDREALKLNVIDMIAPDLNTLISQLDGREVTMLGGTKVSLQTQNAVVEVLKMNWVEDLLYTISDPNIAYILMSLAILGITTEIFNPGLIFPGTVGAISLLLAFFSLGVLPVNWAGVLLIVLAFGLFIGEALTASFGLFTMGGIASLVIGSLILFKGGSPLFRVDPWLIATVTILIAGFFAFVVSRVLGAHHRQPATGREGLIGKPAVVKVALNPEGVVMVKGELWRAISESGPINPGEEVTITNVDGLTLHVNKKQ
ncbi:MAG: nodulation protein NfeD [Chloroflexi bacterium]|nr:nodulation protein NfeD [Chloroflexota bacterium]